MKFKITLLDADGLLVTRGIARDFTRAAGRLLSAAAGLTCSVNPELYRILAELAWLADAEGRFERRREDFSTPEENFTLVLEITKNGKGTR